MKRAISKYQSPWATLPSFAKKDNNGLDSFYTDLGYSDCIHPSIEYIEGWYDAEPRLKWFQEITKEDIANGLPELYKYIYNTKYNGRLYPTYELFERGPKPKFYTKDNKMYIAVPNLNKGVDYSKLTEVPEEEIQRQLPKRDFIGGTSQESRSTITKKIPGLLKNIQYFAQQYHISPELLYHRYSKEGNLDGLIDIYNYWISTADQSTILQDYMNSSVSGMGGGLDYSHENLSNGNYKLVESANTTYMGSAENEKHQTTYPLEFETVKDYLNVLAADLKYRQDELRKRGIPEEDLDVYTNAAFNLGLNHKLLNDRNYIMSQYSWNSKYDPDFSIKYKQGGRLARKYAIGGVQYIPSTYYKEKPIEEESTKPEGYKLEEDPIFIQTSSHIKTPSKKEETTKPEGYKLEEDPIFIQTSSHIKTPSKKEETERAPIEPESTPIVTTFADPDKFIPFLKHWEGERPNESKTEPGGISIRGLTLSTYNHLTRQNLNKDQFKALYKSANWESAWRNAYHAYIKDLHIDKLKSQSIANRVIDWAWGSGQQTAIKRIQRALGIPTTGTMDTTTIQALNYGNEQNICSLLDTARGNHFDQITANKRAEGKDYSKINIGWHNRLNSMIQTNGILS